MFRSDQIDPKTDPWFQEIRQNRRQAVILTLSIFLIAVLLAVVTFQQYLLTSSPAIDAPERDEEAVAPSPERPAPARPTIALYQDPDAGPRMIILQEALADMEDTVETLGADDPPPPLNRHWVKQLAYHIVHAEQAEREGLNRFAVESYEKALRIFPGLVGLRERIGLLHLADRNYDAAIENLEEAAADGMTFSVANNLGTVYLQMENFERAEEVLRQAVDLQPDYAPLHYNLAMLYLRTGRADRAITHFSAFLEQDPGNVEASLAYAATLMQMGEWTTAVNVLRRVNEATGQSPPVYFRLAQALAQTGERDEALDTLRRGVALVDARHALAWMARREFDPLRQHEDFQRIVTELSAMHP